jgi:hypothetical protein
VWEEGIGTLQNIFRIDISCLCNRLLLVIVLFTVGPVSNCQVVRFFVIKLGLCGTRGWSLGVVK